MPRILPTWPPGPPILPWLLSLLAALLASCSDERPQQQGAQTEAIPPVYLEALQNAEAARHSLEQYEVEQRRVDALLERGEHQPADR